TNSDYSGPLITCGSPDIGNGLTSSLTTQSTARAATEEK
ncbi:unnamed protein product, partial [Musa acuminata subsp. burmannicoides]